MRISGFDGVLAAAQEGSEWAWEILVRNLGPSLHRFFASRRLPDPDAMVGEVFADLARNLETFHGDETAFRSWVFVIAYRRMSDEWRRRGRRPSETLTDQSPEPAQRTASAEDEAIALLGNDEVNRLLSVLTDDQRDVISLRVIGGLSLGDTATAMGKPVGAIKALQRRALAALRREISRQGVSI